MKNLKVYRIIPGSIAIITTLPFLLGGCSSENEESINDSVSIIVEKTNSEIERDKSSNISGFHYLLQENKNKKNYEYVLKCGDINSELLYLNKYKTYTTEFMKGINDKSTIAMSSGFFTRHMHYVLPDCYKWLANKFNTNLCEFIIRVKEFNSNNNNRYLLYETEIVFKKEPSNVPTVELKELDKFIQKTIHKGDSLYCKYLFIQRYDLEKGDYLVPIAFEQTGMGSECENVQAYKDEILPNQTEEYRLVSLDELGIIEESTELADGRTLRFFWQDIKNKK